MPLQVSGRWTVCSIYRQIGQFYTVAVIYTPVRFRTLYGYDDSLQDNDCLLQSYIPCQTECAYRNAAKGHYWLHLVRILNKVLYVQLQEQEGFFTG